MNEWAAILLVFIAVTAVIVMVAVLINSRVRAGMKLPGRAEFYIDTSRGGWRERSKRRPAQSAPRLSAAAPRFYLEMKLQHGPNWVYPLEGKAPVYIGRREDNNLRLTDPTADTSQAVIYWEAGRYKINNLSARVPTRVNGRPITRQNLGDGNTIQMGRTKLIFRDRSK
jgi:hypothetical protein